MEKFDIPYFAGNTASRDLIVGVGSRIRDYFDIQSYDKTIQRFAQADSISMNLQLSIIEGVFTARHALAPSTSPSSNGEGSPEYLSVSNDPPLNYLAIAEQIADDILKAGIYGKDKSVTWLSIDIIPGTGQYQYQPVGPSLYAGQIGIGLFFAALSITSDNKNYKNTALNSVASLLKLLTAKNVDAANVIARDLGIGGCVGLGSLIYGLSVLSRLLNIPAMLEDAIHFRDYRYRSF